MQGTDVIPSSVRSRDVHHDENSRRDTDTHRPKKSLASPPPTIGSLFRCAKADAAKTVSVDGRRTGFELRKPPSAGEALFSRVGRAVVTGQETRTPTQMPTDGREWPQRAQPSRVRRTGYRVLCTCKRTGRQLAPASFRSVNKHVDKSSSSSAHDCGFTSFEQRDWCSGKGPVVENAAAIDPHDHHFRISYAFL